jgi:hypothetical protein
MAKLPGPIELEVSDLASIWRDTGNPAAAWRCFALARENNLPVPAAVDAEIMRFAQAVTAPLADDRGSITAGTVAESWGITRGRKPAPELRNTLREFDLYFSYWNFRRMTHRKDGDGQWIDIPGKPHGEAVSALVNKFDKSPKTIEGILTDLFKRHGPDDPWENPAFRDP